MPYALVSPVTHGPVIWSRKGLNVLLRGPTSGSLTSDLLIQTPDPQPLPKTLGCSCFNAASHLQELVWVYSFNQVLKLLHTSYRLIESWETPSKNLGNPNHISEKLADLKMGIGVLIEVEQRFIRFLTAVLLF